MEIKMEISVNRVNHFIYNTNNSNKFNIIGEFDSRDLTLINEIIKLIDERVKDNGSSGTER